MMGDKAMIKRACSLLWLAVFLAAGCAQQPTIRVTDAWARPGFAGGNSAVYFTLENQTNLEVVLVSAQTGVASHVELHRSEMGAHGTIHMHPQESVHVPAGARVEFEPGGLHLMLIDLPEPLMVNQNFSLTLIIEDAEELTVQVEVRDP
jgi:periplasmic copper chaperone A